MDIRKIVDYSRLNRDIDSLSKSFQTAQPFPYIEIDGLFKNTFLDEVLGEFPKTVEDYKDWDIRNNDGIEVKLRSNWKSDDDAPLSTFNLIQALNSGNFLRFLEKLTGIEGLIPDPYLVAGGMNEIRRGGTLAVHADGNKSDRMGLFRKLNAIVYLNKDWNPDWGGQLQLWDTDLTKCLKKIEPVFNKMIVFDTSETSMHGHPDALNCPTDRSRKSIILYYYISENQFNLDKSKKDRHSAIFYKGIS